MKKNTKHLAKQGENIKNIKIFFVNVWKQKKLQQKWKQNLDKRIVSVTFIDLILCKDSFLCPFETTTQ